MLHKLHGIDDNQHDSDGDDDADNPYDGDEDYDDEMMMMKMVLLLNEGFLSAP